MPERLESSRLKLERARHHFKEAQSCVESWRDYLKENHLRPFFLETKLEPQAGYYSVRFDMVRTPPVELSLIVGDCAHNLRSALDHLAWQIVPLAFREDPQNRRRLSEVSFPITSDESTWRGLVGSKVPDIPSEQKAILRRHQPFNLPHAKRIHHPLALLRHVNNTDKHRIILVTVVGVHGNLKIGDIFITIGGFLPTRIERLDAGGGMIAKEGAEVARVHGITLVGQEKPHVNVTMESVNFIGFGDGYPVLDGLKLMVKEVESIISDIEEII